MFDSSVICFIILIKLFVDFEVIFSVNTFA